MISIYILILHNTGIYISKDSCVMGARTIAANSSPQSTKPRCQIWSRAPVIFSSDLAHWPVFSGVKQRWEIISQMMKNPPYGNTVVKNIMGIYYCLYLVGGIPTPPKNMKVNVKDDIPYIMDNKIHVPNHQPAIVYCLSDCVMDIMIIMGPLINVMVPYHWIFFDAYDRHRTQPLPGDQLTPHLQRAEEEPSKVSRTRQTYRRGPFWCHRHLFPYGDLWCLCKMHHVIWIKWR